MFVVESMHQYQSSKLNSPEDGALEISVNPPFDFALYHNLCLRGYAMPLPHVYSRTSWRCIIGTFSGKNIPVQVMPVKNCSRSYLMVDILCDHSTDEEAEIKKCIARVFCSDLDLLPFYEKALNDTGFSEVVKRLVGLKPYLSQEPFEALIKAVVRQLVRAELARHAIMMLVLRFGTKRIVEERNYYGFPPPEVLSKAPKNKLIECKLGYKWELVKKLSDDIVSGDLDLYQLGRHRDDKIIQRLEEYRGIGYWTSRIFLYDGLGRLNAYPIRDISLRKAVSLIYFQRKPISWEEVESFFTRYKERVGIATNYLFGALWLEQCSLHANQHRSEFVRKVF